MNKQCSKTHTLNKNLLLFMLGLFLGSSISFVIYERKETKYQNNKNYITNKLLDLYTFCYVESDYLNRKIQLKNAIISIEKNILRTCNPDAEAQPSLKKHCKQEYLKYNKYMKRLKGLLNEKH